MCDDELDVENSKRNGSIQYVDILQFERLGSFIKADGKV